MKSVKLRRALCRLAALAAAACVALGFAAPAQALNILSAASYTWSVVENTMGMQVSGTMSKLNRNSDGSIQPAAVSITESTDTSIIPTGGYTATFVGLQGGGRAWSISDASGAVVSGTIYTTKNSRGVLAGFAINMTLAAKTTGQTTCTFKLRALRSSGKLLIGLSIPGVPVTLVESTREVPAAADIASSVAAAGGRAGAGAKAGAGARAGSQYYYYSFASGTGAEIDGATLDEIDGTDEASADPTQAAGASASASSSASASADPGTSSSNGVVRTFAGIDVASTSEFGARVSTVAGEVLSFALLIAAAVAASRRRQAEPAVAPAMPAPRVHPRRG